MCKRTMKIAVTILLAAAVMCSMIFMTGCGSSKTANPETKAPAQETTTPVAEQQTTESPSEENAPEETTTEETTSVSGVVFEVGGVQVGIADPNQQRPEGAPEGGDGKTAYSDEELQAKQVEIANSGNRKNMTYADYVEALDGTEGKWTPFSFTDRWKYTWYSATEATRLEVIFTAETGLYNSDTFYK